MFPGIRRVHDVRDRSYYDPFGYFRFGKQLYEFLFGYAPYNADAAFKESLRFLQGDDFRRYYTNYEYDIRKILVEKTREEDELSKGFAGKLDKASDREVEAKMAGLIGVSLTNIIKSSFDIETYNIVIQDRPGRVSNVHITRGGGEFMPAVKLRSSEDVKEVSTMQVISLVIEIFLFILSVIGIRTHLNDMQMRAAMREAGEVVGSPQFERALTEYLQRWENGTRWQRSIAIFYFLKDGVPLSAFWKIIKAILTDMSTKDYIIAVAEITALIVVTFGTDGAALIAKIFLALNDAVRIERKVSNIIKLQAKKV